MLAVLEHLFICIHTHIHTHIQQDRPLLGCQRIARLARLLDLRSRTCARDELFAVVYARCRATATARIPTCMRSRAPPCVQQMRLIRPHTLLPRTRAGASGPGARRSSAAKAVQVHRDILSHAFTHESSNSSAHTFARSPARTHAHIHPHTQTDLFGSTCACMQAYTDVPAMSVCPSAFCVVIYACMHE